MLKDMLLLLFLSLVYLDSKNCKEKEECKRFKETRKAARSEVKLKERTLHSSHVTWDSILQISNSSTLLYLDKQINISLCRACVSPLLSHLLPGFDALITLTVSILVHAHMFFWPRTCVCDTQLKFQRYIRTFKKTYASNFFFFFF